MPIEEITCNARMDSFNKQHADLKDILKLHSDSINIRLDAMNKAVVNDTCGRSFVGKPTFDLVNN